MTVSAVPLRRFTDEGGKPPDALDIAPEPTLAGRAGIWRPATDAGARKPKSSSFSRGTRRGGGDQTSTNAPGRTSQRQVGLSRQGSSSREQARQYNHPQLVRVGHRSLLGTGRGWWLVPLAYPAIHRGGGSVSPVARRGPGGRYLVRVSSPPATLVSMGRPSVRGKVHWSRSRAFSSQAGPGAAGLASPHSNTLAARFL